MSNMDWLQTLLGGVSGAFTGASVANDRRSREAELARQAARQMMLDERQAKLDTESAFDRGIQRESALGEMGYERGPIARTGPAMMALPGMGAMDVGAVMDARIGPQMTTPDGASYTLNRFQTPTARNQSAMTAKREEARAELERRAREREADQKFTAGENAKGRASAERIAGIRSAPRPPATGGAAFGNLMLIPPTQRAAVIDNRTKMGVIDQAMEALETRPESVGLDIGLTPQFMRDRENSAFNPLGDAEGVPVRALIGNLASMEIKDRSGAAVTAAEFPRLIPFIPILSGPNADSYENIMWKLQKFKEVIREENLAIGDGFGIDLTDYTNNTSRTQRGAAQNNATATTQQSPESLARNLVLNARKANPMGRPR